MNPATEAGAKKLAKSIDKKNVVICPPFEYLSAVHKVLKKAKLGSQDVFWENPKFGGAYTGEISPTMLKNIGVKNVIIGHSETRRYLNETDIIVNKKVLSALKSGLKVILCVGEPAKIRKRGSTASKVFVKNQILNDLKGIQKLKTKVKNLTVAYEPIWAISTSRDKSLKETPELILEMVKFIKNSASSRFAIRNLPVFYGGSVTSKNIARIIKHTEIAGALVGGASLSSSEFNKIIKITFK